MKNLTEKFEDYINQNHMSGIWKTYVEIEKITGVEIHDVIEYLDSSKNFCRNSQNKFTTRKMYDRYIPFFEKLRDSFAGRLI
jgi:hypothetical protein